MPRSFLIKKIPNNQSTGTTGSKNISTKDATSHRLEYVIRSRDQDEDRTSTEDENSTDYVGKCPELSCARLNQDLHVTFSNDNTVHTCFLRQKYIEVCLDRYYCTLLDLTAATRALDSLLINAQLCQH